MDTINSNLLQYLHFEKHIQSHSDFYVLRYLGQLKALHKDPKLTASKSGFFNPPATNRPASPVL